ncbi:MAG: hypothetical protein R2711_07200 [Acidimicrobiales bacterium]
MARIVVPSVEGILTADEVQATVDRIAEWQLADGMIPWFPGGHADPWNHVEAAMALALGGRVAEAERAYDWLVGLQRPDGAWHQYYVEGGVEDDKFDLNVVAYVAAGVAPLPAHARPRLRRGDVARGREGHRLRARAPAAPRRDPLGPPRRRHAVALRPAHRLVEHLPLAALRHRPRRGARPRAPRLGAELGAARRRHRQPRGRRLRPKHRWAMDWYYPVLGGAVVGEAGRARLAERYETFVDDERGVRCVKDRPWITVAETCECVMAHLAVGEREIGERLFGWIQQYRVESGRYWTGTVYPDLTHFPADEQSTYTAAAVVLAADALWGEGPTSALFADHDAVLPRLLDIPDDDPVRD